MSAMSSVVYKLILGQIYVLFQVTKMFDNLMTSIGLCRIVLLNLHKIHTVFRKYAGLYMELDLGFNFKFKACEMSPLMPPNMP